MLRKIYVKELEQEYLFCVSNKIEKKINCRGNLFLRVGRTGFASWNVRVRDNNKDTYIKIGEYPNLSLAKARALADQILKKKKEKMESSNKPLFGDYKNEWLSYFLSNEKNEFSHKNNKRFMTLRASLKHLSSLDQTPLDYITPQLVDRALSNEACSQGAKHYAIRALNQCLNSAVIDGIILANPCNNMLNTKGLISKKYAKPKSKGYAWVPADELKRTLFEKTVSMPEINRYFTLFTAFTCLRVGSVRELEWDWIDPESNTISIPAEHMKMGKAFEVPITPFISALLNEWKSKCELNKQKSKYVFFAKSSLAKPIRLTQVQEMVALCTSQKVTLHGLRKTARTWMAEIGVSEEIAEQTLAHERQNQIVKTYNKFNYLRLRYDVLCLWNYYLYINLPKEYSDLLGIINTDLLAEYEKQLRAAINDFSPFKYSLKLELI